jgi:Phosphate-selective porin O and P
MSMIHHRNQLQSPGSRLKLGATKTQKRAGRSIRFLGLVAANLVAVASIARADSAATSRPSPRQSGADLRQELDELNAKVDRLENRQQGAAEPGIGGWTISTSGDSPQFFSNAGLATGYDPLIGFVIRSDNGEFSLHPGIVFDFRNMTSYRERLAPGNGSEVPRPRYSTENGFDVTRLRLTLDGNFTKNVTYALQFQDDQGANFGLLDAYAVYHFNDSPFAIKAGQFKDPVWHERSLPEPTLLAVDRSLVEALLGGGQASRVQGVSFMYDQGPLRAQAVIHDGFDSINTKFFDSGGIAGGVGGGAGVTPMDYGFSARAEGLLIGNRTPQFNPFTQYDRGFTALGAGQDILVLGAGGDFSQAGANSILLHSVDLQYDNTNGCSAYVAYLGSYRDLTHNQGVAPGHYYDPGFVVQAAYLVTPKIEPFARYDYTYLARGSAPSLATGEVQEITIGANYYIHKQNLKLTLDASYLPNGAPADSDALGILKDSGNNEVVVRAQFQLAL